MKDWLGDKIIGDDTSPFDPEKFTYYLGNCAAVIFAVLIIGVAFHALAVNFGITGISYALAVAIVLSSFFSAFKSIRS